MDQDFYSQIIETEPVEAISEEEKLLEILRNLSAEEKHRLLQSADRTSPKIQSLTLANTKVLAKWEKTSKFHHFSKKCQQKITVKMFGIRILKSVNEVDEEHRQLENKKRCKSFI